MPFSKKLFTRNLKNNTESENARFISTWKMILSKSMNLKLTTAEFHKVRLNIDIKVKGV